MLIREGLRDVPAMKEVVDGHERRDDRRAGAATIAAQPVEPAAATARRGEAPARRRQSRAARCAAPAICPTTAAQSQVPRLAGQNEAYLLQSMKQFRDNPAPGRDTIMASTLRGLSDAELANLAHYLATYKP